MEHPDENSSEQNSSDDQFEEQSDSHADDKSDKVDSDEQSSDEDGDKYSGKQENPDESDENDEEEEDGDEHLQDQDEGNDESGDNENDKVAQDEDDSDGNSDDDLSSPSRTRKRKSSENIGLLDLESIKRSKKDGGKKPSKPGIIYLSRIPPFMKPKKLNFIFGQYGQVGRIFLQQEDKNRRKMRKKIGGNKSRAYTEGWIEFKKKRLPNVSRSPSTTPASATRSAVVIMTTCGASSIFHGSTGRT